MKYKKGGKDFKEIIENPLNILIESGLKDLINSQRNFINFSLSSKQSFRDILDNFTQKTDSLSACFLKNSRLEVNFELDKNLYGKLTKIVDKIDPEFALSPPIMFIKYFKMLDVDLRFFLSISF